MSMALELFDNQDVKHAIRTQFKMIRKSEITIENVLTQLSDRLADRHPVTQSRYELIVKVDKRKNLNTVHKEVEGLLKDIQVNFNLGYLVSVTAGNSEIIVRARRK